MDAKDILKKSGLRSTEQRLLLLSFLLDSKNAHSSVELENVFKNKIDRVSIYRILYAFSEAGILCKLIDSSGTVRYVFDKHMGAKQNQPHFRCKSCKDVVELPALPSNYMEHLKELKVDEINILAEGICKECFEQNYEQ